MLPVVNWSQCVEPLLPGRVPDGERDPLAAEVQLLCQEGGLKEQGLK